MGELKRMNNFRVFVAKTQKFINGAFRNECLILAWEAGYRHVHGFLKINTSMCLGQYRNPWQHLK